MNVSNRVDGKSEIGLGLKSHLLSPYLVGTYDFQARIVAGVRLP